MFLSSVLLDLTYNKWQQYSHGQWAEIINIPKYASVNNIPEKRKFQTTEDGRLVQLNYRFKLRTLKTYFDFLHRKLLCSSFSNHNMKWERKVHKIGLLRRFMRIAWTLNSSTRRYLRSLCPPWPVLHHHQPYDGTCSPQFSECQVGQNWSLCKYLTIFSSHGCGNLGQVGMDGCYNSVYFEEASIAVEFRC